MDALIIAPEIFLSRSLFLKLTIAAAFLIIAIDFIKTGLTRKSPISKYFFDLCVDAPQYLSEGIYFANAVKFFSKFHILFEYNLLNLIH